MHPLATISGHPCHIVVEPIPMLVVLALISFSKHILLYLFTSFTSPSEHDYVNISFVHVAITSSSDSMGCVWWPRYSGIWQHLHFHVFRHW